MGIGGRRMLVWHVIAIILTCAVALPVSVKVVFADDDTTLMSMFLAVFGSMVAFTTMSFVGTFWRMEKNALSARLTKAMPGKCVACGKPILPGENRSDYHFVRDNWTTHTGTLSVHHNPECAGAGLGFLEKYSQEDDKNTMVAVHRIGDRTYLYDFLVNDNGFFFKISAPHDTLNDATISFLRAYRRSHDVVLAVRHGTYTPDRIPILLPAQSPHINQAEFSGKAHQKAIREAETVADRGVAVLGCSGIQEAKILSQYARDTFIEFSAGSPVNALKPTVEDPKRSRPSRDHKG